MSPMKMPTKGAVIGRAAKTLCISRIESKLVRNGDHDIMTDYDDKGWRPCRRCRNDCAELYDPLMAAYADMLDFDSFAENLGRIVEVFATPPAVM